MRKLSIEDELLLARYIKEKTESTGGWLSWGAVAEVAHLLNHRQIYTYKWFTKFCERHTLTLKHGRVTPMDPRRILSENTEAITKWFNDNRNVMEGVPAEDMYNVDESGFDSIVTFDTRPMGSRKVTPRKIDVGKSTHISVIDCISAEGAQVPPMVVVAKRGPLWLKNLEKEAENSHRNWAFRYQENGYADSVIFLEWLMHFDKCTRKGTVAHPRVLFLDGFREHFSNEILKYAEENEITLVAFPPKLTHLIQPLDVFFFWSTEK